MGSRILASMAFALWGAALSVDAAPRAGHAQPPQAVQDPSEADTLLAQAMELHRAGDLMSAIKGYKAALKLDPARPDIRSNLGAALVRLGRISEAVSQYQKALAVEDNPQIRFNLALAYYKANRVDEAIPALQQVVKADASNRPAALLLGDCLLQVGREQDVVDLLGR